MKYELNDQFHSTYLELRGDTLSAVRRMARQGEPERTTMTNQQIRAVLRAVENLPASTGPIPTPYYFVCTVEGVETTFVGVHLPATEGRLGRQQTLIFRSPTDPHTSFRMIRRSPTKWSSTDQISWTYGVPADTKPYFTDTKNIK